MEYLSTRGSTEAVNGAGAVIRGIAPDGGLYIPTSFPSFPVSLEEFVKMDYYQTAENVMAPFFPEFDQASFHRAVLEAYTNKFDSKEIVEVEKVGGFHVLELFHGPTLAFKDMALSMLPELMSLALKVEQSDNEIAILTATSGDTGKAAMAGFKNKPGFSIVVFYPSGKVSKMQYLQMATENGENCFVAAIDGNFDDTQTGVKKIFTDPYFKEDLNSAGLQLSAANSINIGRLLPQVAYYVYGYSQMVKDGTIKLGESINVSVPSGNFGNILAAYIAKEMGLPIKKFICSSNDNHVLADFFETGSYDRKRDLKVTTSPSMDILVSSNLERLLYLLSGRDGKQVDAWMNELSTTGKYTVTDSVKKAMDELFFPYWADEKTVSAGIKDVYEKNQYVMDPHTAIGYLAAEEYQTKTGDKTPTLVASTASPFKFSDTMCDALGFDMSGTKNIFDVARLLAEETHLPFPEQIADLEKAPIRFNDEFKINQMEDVVGRFLGILE